MRLRKNWRDYLITGEQAEELDEAFIVFEEDEKGTKHYDLCKGIFSDLEVAKEYADAIKDDDKKYVANYSDYIEGMYNYLFETN